MSEDMLTVTLRANVALITLNRPEALNALNLALMRELAAEMTSLDADPDVRCIVLTGSDKAFAAGADVKEMAGKGFAEMFMTDLYGPETEAILRVSKPVIAAVAGFCLGGGCELAMLCDFILAADTAKFGQPEVNLGIIPGMGGTQRMTRAVGKAKSMELHLTGRFMDAAEAERAGLVARVVPAADLIAEALKTAGKIAAKSAVAVKAAKEAVNRADELSLREGVLHERRLFHALFATHDQKEGMAAFLEKRAPAFQDR